MSYQFDKMKNQFGIENLEELNAAFDFKINYDF